jgi:two-component system response regulator
MITDEQEHQKTNRIPRARARRAAAFKTPADPGSDQIQREVLAKLRHDLRTPLNAIIGYSEMLLEDMEDFKGYEELVSDLKNILSTGRESLNLVNTILDPEKIESSPAHVGLASFGINLRHELHTPLNAILRFAERLLKHAESRKDGDDFIKEFILDAEKIQSAAESFLTLLKDTEKYSGADAETEIREAKFSRTSEEPRIIRTSANADPGIVTADCGNLLVVDDNEMNRDLMCRHLERQGHQVTTAENGRQAMTMIQEHTFDLVLLDIMMPELNGYQVLQYLKANDNWRNIPVLMISALDEMDSVVRCIEMGAEDYLPKPVDPVLLKARIGAVLEKKRLRDKEQLYLKNLEKEMKIGRRIQASFLPDSLPCVQGWEIAARFHPARQVSGDFYDAFSLSKGQGMGIVVADVCDKGVGAALFMGLFRSLIRAFGELHYSSKPMAINQDNETSPASSDKTMHEYALKTIVSLTNDYIAKNHSKANMFATIFLGMIDPESGEVVYINGGHEPPVITGPNGVKAHLEPTGPAVGMIPGIPFESGKAQIKPGEMLVAFTDGITEAMDPQDQLYGKERLLSLLSDPDVSAEALLDQIETDLRRHTAGADQSDDITVLAVRREV